MIYFWHGKDSKQRESGNASIHWHGNEKASAPLFNSRHEASDGGASHGLGLYGDPPHAG
jgi:hypothetical protein